MAYRKRSTGRRTSYSRSTGRRRSSSTGRRRASTSRRSSPRETRLVIEIAPASPVSRPASYLSALNPAFTGGNPTGPGKAKL